jgi:hypothetical protein
MKRSRKERWSLMKGHSSKVTRFEEIYSIIYSLGLGVFVIGIILILITNSDLGTYGWFIAPGIIIGFLGMLFGSIFFGWMGEGGGGG